MFDSFFGWRFLGALLTAGFVVSPVAWSQVGASAQAQRTVDLVGYAQVDGVLWDQSSRDEIDVNGAPLNDTRFFVRRARIRALTSREYVSGVVELDGNTIRGPEARLMRAEATLQWRGTSTNNPPELGVYLTGGIFRPTFGREPLTEDRARIFLESTSMTRSLFPGERDVGIRLKADWHFLHLDVSATNGQALGERSFALRDPNRDKDFMGRVMVETPLTESVKLSTALSGLWGRGFHRGTPSTKDSLAWRDTNEDGLVQVSELQSIPGSAAGPSKNFRRNALGADVRVSVALPYDTTLWIDGELIWAKNLDRNLWPANPVAIGRPMREFGYAASAELRSGTGALVGLRYDHYNPDADANEQRAFVRVPLDASFSTLGVVGGFGWQNQARVLLQYSHNTNPLGRDINGEVATLADDSLVLRAEVSF